MDTGIKYEPASSSVISYSTAAFQNWIARERTTIAAPLVCSFDFDGTLTPRFADDSAHFDSIEADGRVIHDQMRRLGGAFGICTSRSLNEVARIITQGFNTPLGESCFGFSAAETGAALFCPKLAPTVASWLAAEIGAKVVSIPGFDSWTTFSLSRISVDDLREKVIIEAARASGIVASRWSSSVHEFDSDPQALVRLTNLSRHVSAQQTLDSCTRLGTAYVKISGTEHDSVAQGFVSSLIALATYLGASALVTRPMPEHPVWTVDFGSGVTKADALSAVAKAYSKLLRRGEADLHIAYFGDGENDIPAFRYLAARSRPAISTAYLVDRPGGNMALANQLPPNVYYLQRHADLSGVLAGLTRIQR